MYWTCKSCGTKNPENAPACGKCGSKTEAPKKFYPASIFGGAIVFVLVYLIGTSFGGTLVAFSLEPSDAEILAEAKSMGIEAKAIESVGPQDRKKAKEAVIEEAKKSMSRLVHSILFWIVPFLLFPLCGAAIGYISAGRTVLEAAIGSTVGQIIGYVAMRVMYKVPISIIELVAGLIVGFLLAGIGAYVGEAIQEKRERAVLEETDAEEASFG